jgi:hypothetical protein
MQHAQGSIRSTMHGAFAGWLRDHVRWALMLLLVFSGILGPISQNGTALFPTASAHGLSASTPPNPNHLSPSANTTSVKHPNLGKGTTANAPAGPPQSLKRTGGISMQPGKLALAAGHATTFKGSDGRLEIDVPSGAVTSADVAAAGGYMSLLISQIAPASGSSAGGSGIVSFGTYLVQAVDAQGVLLTHGLRQPVTLKLHYAARESALDLSHAFAVFNGPLPDATDLAPLSLAVHLQQPGRIAGGAIDDSSSAVTPTMANSHFGAHASQAASLDTKGQSLVVPLTLKDPSGSMSFNTDSPVATFGKPDPFNVDLNAGALTSSFPIDVPSGPGGLTPPVDLTYSSAGVSEQHNPQGADGWVGEGWNLDLGSISWAEHNSNASCTSGCGNGWEDSWDLSDPFGTSVELIPPNINVATYFDDTTNGITASPIRWHTTPENYAKVYSYTSSLTLPDGAGVHPPCFRVFLTNGIMEEFGCTADSLEYYYAAGKGDYISSWKLDLITDRQGNQIHITYQQASGSYWYGTGYHTFVMDAVLNTIEWDSPSCHDAQNMCAGANWAPLMRVSFAASLVPSRLTSTLGTCNPASWYRCDDPLDLSPSGGLYPPEVQSVYALNDVYVQVRGSGTGSWNTLKDYQFSYAQKGPTGYNDPTTGKAASAAGYLWLTRLVTVGDDGATALPPRTFSYAWVNNYYVDDVYHPHSNAGCWPVWNTGTGSGCLLWNVSYDNNSWYLATADNGMGLHQTFSWATARNNSHGVNGRGSMTTTPSIATDSATRRKRPIPATRRMTRTGAMLSLPSRKGT